jgi:hypothetical protein
MEAGRYRCMVATVDIMEGSNSCVKGKTFKYLGSVLTNQN